MKRLSILATSITLAASAQSAVVSDSFSNPLQNTEIAQTGSLDLFDSDLGILNSAVLTLRGDSAGTISLTISAQSTAPQNVRGTSIVELDFSSSLAGLQAILNGGSPDIGLSMTTGLQTLNPGQTVQFLGLVDSDTDVLDLAALLGALSQPGGGLFNVGCSSLSGLTVTGGGGFAGGSQATQAGCGAEIVYNYTPGVVTQVPEPVSLALAGLALVGLGATSRRRKT